MLRLELEVSTLRVEDPLHEEVAPGREQAGDGPCVLVLVPQVAHDLGVGRGGELGGELPAVRGPEAERAGRLGRIRSRIPRWCRRR